MTGKVANTLRFYKWRPSAVSVGRFQRISQEVHIENCRRFGVDVVRRMTGGGAVYHDQGGELTYSVVISQQDLGSKDLISNYNAICQGLVEAVKILGVDADFNPGDPKQCPNTTIEGRKFSGNAQFQSRGVLLQHGTFLVQTDLEKMFTFLKVPWARSPQDVMEVARKKLTSMEQELGSSISSDQAYQALVEGFQKALNTELTEQELTDYEKGLAEDLYREKYATDSWTYITERRNRTDKGKRF
ncbi:MAG: lipoate--protein ligase family protein [Desulfobacterales bacterium]|nr:lipoate--protein ligase family protein [Desulfobacterales bacterium]